MFEHQTNDALMREDMDGLVMIPGLQSGKRNMGGQHC